MYLRLAAGNSFARPAVDAAELYYIGVALLCQLFGSLFAPVAASAVNENKLILVRKLRYIVCSDGFVGNADGARDVRSFIFLLCADIKNDIVRHFLHHGSSFFRAHLAVCFFIIS